MTQDEYNELRLLVSKFQCSVAPSCFSPEDGEVYREGMMDCADELQNFLDDVIITHDVSVDGCIVDDDAFRRLPADNGPNG